MARRRRPSIPLIILFIILLLLFLLSGTLVELVSNWAARGSFTFSYTATWNDPVVSIVYTLPQDFAEAIVPEQTEGWTVTLADNSLSLTGGTLNSEESVMVNYRLTKYIKGGTRNYTATATTESGFPIPKDKSFEVPEILLLALAGMLHQNAIWLLVLAIIVLVVIIVLFVLGAKKEKEQEQKEETSTTSPQKANLNPE
jgi:hypothetical protein